MEAIGVHRFGGPEALELVEVPDVQAASGQVRIRVHAAAVNPSDTLLRSGAIAAAMTDHTPPYVPGMDVAGVIDQIGAGADSRLAIGQAVIAIVSPTGPLGGAYAERVVAPAASVVPMPAGLGFPAASTLLMNAATADLALELLALTPGQSLAITGAAGAFGGYAIQLAKAQGLRVIADAGPTDEATVAGLGADEVVARGDDVADRIRALVPSGVAGVADGALLNPLVAPAVADGGGIAIVRSWLWTEPAPRGITVHPVNVLQVASDTARLERLSDQARDGTLSLRVASVFPATEAPRAHRLLEAGGVRGRLVLDLTTIGH